MYIITDENKAVTYTADGSTNEIDVTIVTGTVHCPADSPSL